ncbi:MAG: S9 family peptidase [Pseudoxanthomonas sp.]
MSRSAWAARALIGPALASLALAAAAAEPPTPAQIMQLAVVGDPQLSTDGQRIAYTVETPQGEGKDPLSRIRVVAFDGGSVPFELPGEARHSDRSPRWAGDGSLLFLSDRAPAQAGDPPPAAAQVWQAQTDGRGAHPLTRAASDVSAFALAADGRSLYYLAADPQTAQDRARAESKNDAVERDHPRRFVRAWRLDLDTGAARVLTPPGLQVHDLAPSPDGRTLALRVSAGTTLNDYWYDSRVQLLDLAAGTLAAPLEPHASAFPLQWSPDGRRLLYGQLSENGMVGRIFVQTVPAGACAGARSCGARVELAPDWPGSLRLAYWQDDATLVGAGLRGVHGELLRIDAASGRWRTLARPQFAWPAASVARAGRIALLGMRQDHPAEVWTFDHGRLSERTDSNPQVAGWAHARVRELQWTSSRDGRPIHGVLVTPPDWQRGDGPLPTLVQIHGGPAEAWWSGWLGSWHEWAQLLATRGYAVLLPNPRGSEGQGPAFTELARGDWGDGPLQDVLDGVDMLERDGVADPKRLAIGGWSYGGYLSAWAAGHTDRFRTAIVGAGVTDIGAMALTTDVPDYLPGYFGDPLGNRTAYDAQSPIRYAGQVRIPLLVLHGEADQRVPIEQGAMFYRALKFNRTPVQMVSYPRGPHWFHEQAAGRDVQERVLAWLDKYLRGP